MNSDRASGENYANPEALVSTAWLAERLTAPDVRIVDASWYLPQLKRDAKAEYRAAHIPGAVFFDIDEIADTANPLPHMLPSPEKFTSRMRKLGLGDGSRIVVYDGSGVNSSAPRAWWMFRVFGHRDVAVLDGGFRKWQAEGRPIEDLPPVPRERHFTARFDRTLVRDIDQMQANLAAGREQVVDARARGRFLGSEPEPRPGLRGGHIPGSRNLPFQELVDADGTMLNAATLRKRVAEAGIDMSRPVVASCGSGVTACVLALSLHLLGHREVAVYDGSWAEWGSRTDTPIETSGA
jgi:thiosulfate/3-mercaptopyruvate sulfurtransferase